MIAHRDKETGRTQTIFSHSLETAEICEKTAASLGLGNLCRLIALCHDIGKASADFQDYIGENINNRSKADVDHTTAGMRYIFAKLWKPGDQFAMITAQICACAVASHHDGLINIVDMQGNSEFENLLSKNNARTTGTEAVPEIDPTLSELTDGLLREAVNETAAVLARLRQLCPKKQEFFFAVGLLLRMILSILIDADKQNAYEFYTGLKAAPKTIHWDEFLKRLDENGPCEENHEIGKLRAEIAQKCGEAAGCGTGVYELALPCGAGKTVSSLRFAVKHAISNNKKRIFYIMPFTSIIDQNVNMVRSIIGEEGNDIVLGYHGAIGEESDKYLSEIICESWQTQIIFTTNVQVMNALFASGVKASRRMQALADSVLIFDEAQEIPVKYLSLFTCSLNFLAQFCNTTSLLCTSAPLAALRLRKHPAALADLNTIIPGYLEYFAKMTNARPEDARRENGYTVRDLAGFAIEKLNVSRSVLVIVNTKKTAVDLLSELKTESGAYNLYYLSTKMCPAHRENVISKLSGFDSPTICVSTALIESGVDAGFDCVIRSVCGLDSIIQSAGRCNRDGLNPGLSVIYIVNPIGDSIDKLRDVKTARQITERLLDDIKANNSMYGGNIFSPKAIEAYYYHYLFLREDETEYSLDNARTTLFDVLSLNSWGNMEYNRIHGGIPGKYFFTQGFRDAAGLFSPTEESARTVIMPYSSKDGRLDGKKLVARLSVKTDIAEYSELLKEAQRFSIIMFNNEFNTFSLQGAIRPVNEEYGLYALDEEFYDEERGAAFKRNFKCLLF